MSNLDSLQKTIQNLKEIVGKDTDTNMEAALLVSRIEQIINQIERKSHLKDPLVQNVAPLEKADNSKNMPLSLSNPLPIGNSIVFSPIGDSI